MTTKIFLIAVNSAFRNAVLRAVVMFSVLAAASTLQVVAQTSPEAVTVPIEIGKMWFGISANGAKASFDFSGVSFFPNDYNVVANTGKGQEAYG